MALQATPPLLSSSWFVAGQKTCHAETVTARVQITPAFLAGLQSSTSSSLSNTHAAFIVSILQHSYPLRLFLPQHNSNNKNCAWIFISNYGGGFVDGDNIAIQVDVSGGSGGGQNLCAVVTSIGSTKIYAGKSYSTQNVTISSHSTLLLLQKPIVPFRDSIFKQITDIRLEDTTSSLCCVEWLQSGRQAYEHGTFAGGERWQQKSTDTTLQVTVGDMPFFSDRYVLRTDDESISRHMGPVSVIGTVLVCGPKFKKLSAQLLEKCQARYEYGQRPTTAAGFVSANRLELLTLCGTTDDDEEEIGVLNRPISHGCVVKFAFEEVEQAQHWLTENLMPTVLEITGASTMEF